MGDCFGKSGFEPLQLGQPRADIVQMHERQLANRRAGTSEGRPVYEASPSARAGGPVA